MWLSSAANKKETSPPAGQLWLDKWQMTNRRGGWKLHSLYTELTLISSCLLQNTVYTKHVQIKFVLLLFKNSIQKPRNTTQEETNKSWTLTLKTVLTIKRRTPAIKNNDASHWKYNMPQNDSLLSSLGKVRQSVALTQYNEQLNRTIRISLTQGVPRISNVHRSSEAF